MAAERKTVLLVEDDHVIRAWIRACLEDACWTVVGTGDGQQALQLVCGDTPFDLILLDVWLPEMNGLEVLRAMRSLGVGCPVLVMTAYEDSFDREHALDLGAADVLIKPFDIEDLQVRIDRLYGEGDDRLVDSTVDARLAHHRSSAASGRV